MPKKHAKGISKQLSQKEVWILATQAKQIETNKKMPADNRVALAAYYDYYK